MRILVVGTGGVGSAFAAIAQRRSFFDRITLADLDVSRPQSVVDRLDASIAAAWNRSGSPKPVDHGLGAGDVEIRKRDAVEERAALRNRGEG